MSVKIMFSDKSEKKQNEVLKEAGIKNPEDANWDTMPLFIYEVEEE